MALGNKRAAVGETSWVLASILQRLGSTYFTLSFSCEYFLFLYLMLPLEAVVGAWSIVRKGSFPSADDFQPVD